MWTVVQSFVRSGLVLHAIYNVFVDVNLLCTFYTLYCSEYTILTFRGGGGGGGGGGGYTIFSLNNTFCVGVQFFSP